MGLIRPERPGHFVDHLPEVIEEIRYQDTLFGHDRFLARRTGGALSPEAGRM